MYYVDIESKRFVPPHREHPAPPRPPRPPHGRGMRPDPRVPSGFIRPPAPEPPIQRPSLVYTEVVDIPIQFMYRNGAPFDLTDATLVLAVDNDFRHNNELIAFCQDVTIDYPEEGIAVFHVDCSSLKFQRMVRAHIPASQTIMEITYYAPGSAAGKSLLQDRGIQMKPRLYTYEGSPRPNTPYYYTKSQVDSLLKSYAKKESDATQGTIINGHGEPSPNQGLAGDMYIDLDTRALYLRSQTEWIQLGYVAADPQGQTIDLYYDILNPTQQEQING